MYEASNSWASGRNASYLEKYHVKAKLGTMPAKQETADLVKGDSNGSYFLMYKQRMRKLKQAGLQADHNFVNNLSRWICKYFAVRTNEAILQPAKSDCKTNKLLIATYSFDYFWVICNSRLSFHSTSLKSVNTKTRKPADCVLLFWVIWCFCTNFKLHSLRLNFLFDSFHRKGNWLKIISLYILNAGSSQQFCTKLIICVLYKMSVFPC